ncbi:hypothetical protein [Maribacter sp. 2210JD10-5]|uniref:hypothetical protein n=1 Tax=Maribacter sp. 2210JD10-5 TaxID=3386272 RepID=UPI0039BCEADE
MKTNSDNFRRYTHLKVKENSNIHGITGFLRYLEQYYFSEAYINDYVEKKESIDLAIDIKCPIDLVEMLAHFNKERWGHNGESISPLEYALNELTNQNDIFFDIEELTLLLNDTSIVIKRIYKSSIVKQLNNILVEIANHYIFVTKGLTERPFEIFLPVFENRIIKENDSIYPKQATTNHSKCSYFNYWGIYLESQDDALIYDVKKNIYISANLDLCMLDDD